MIRLVLAAWLALCGVANAQLSGGVGGFPGPGTAHTAAAGPAYVYRGALSASGSGAVLTGSIDIGTASADRLVIIGTGEQNARTVSSITVNGVSLTQDAYDSTGPAAGIFSGLVTTGSGPQTVTVTFSAGSFELRTLFLWTATGLASNVVSTTATATSTTALSINVTANDFMFCSAYTLSGATFSSTTQAPTGQRNVATNALGGDWIIASTNASHQVQTVGPVSGTKACATYR